jgi:hypothetical protein
MLVAAKVLQLVGMTAESLEQHWAAQMAPKLAWYLEQQLAEETVC